MKNANTMLISLVVIVIAGVGLYFFQKSPDVKGGGFLGVNKYYEDVPSSLKWKKTFNYEQKRRKSYMQHLIEERKKKGK